MTQKILPALRFVAAAFAGYAAIALGTTLTLEVWLGGFSYTEASAGALALASVGSLASGLIGGYLAAWIGGLRPVLHALGVLIFLTIDTIYVATSGISSGPLWFDLGAGGGLMAATVRGGFVRKAVREQGERAPASV